MTTKILENFNRQHFLINVAIIVVSGVCALVVEHSEIISTYLATIMNPELVWPIMAIVLNLAKYVVRALPILK